MSVSEIVTRDQVTNYLISRESNDSITSRVVHNGVEAVNKLQLWNWFRTYDPPADKGFMYTNHPNIDAMSQETDSEGHSGASFGFTMRYLQRMAKDLVDNKHLFFSLN
jgi:hypothetical protein